MAVVHIEGNEEPDSTHNSDPRRVQVRKGVQEKRCDDTGEHGATLD